MARTPRCSCGVRCARSVAERGHKIKLLAQHDRRRFPIGKATSFDEADDGLHGEFAIPNTREGDDVLELVRSGTLDSFSVGFRPIRDRRQDGVLVRVEAALNEVSLVGLPAYAGAAVAGVRSQQPFIPRAVAEARLLLMNWWRQRIMTELDIEQMTLEQTRAAAQELLDETTGDLAGNDAERFQALSQRAEQIREQQKNRTTAARDMVQRLATGEARTEGEGRDLPGYGTNEDRGPVVSQRDEAMRTLDRAVKAERLAAPGR